MPYHFTDAEIEAMDPTEATKIQLCLQRRTQYYEHIQAQAASSALELTRVSTNMVRSFYIALDRLLGKQNAMMATAEKALQASLQASQSSVDCVEENMKDFIMGFEKFIATMKDLLAGARWLTSQEYKDFQNKLLVELGQSQEVLGHVGTNANKVAGETKTAVWELKARSQNVQKAPASDHFWKFGCWKMARFSGAKHILKQNEQNTTFLDNFWKFGYGEMTRRCGAKHICKSTCTKHTILGAPWEVRMLKNGTPLWREARLQVNMLKKHEGSGHFWSADVENLHAAAAGSTFPS